MAQLRVRIVGETKSPELLCVLCHGYGAPGDDLVPFAAELAHHGIAFAFPEAPIELGFGGRAWWNIDVGRYANAIAAGTLDELMDETPDGLADARKKLREAVDELSVHTKLPMSKIVLGGFSQGAMLTTDLALRLDEAPAALVVMSGTLVCRPEWTKLAPKRKGLQVLQSHGEQDPLLPYSIALELHRMLLGAGLAVDFVSFRGGHGVPPATVEKLGALLRAKVPA
jgi:phospholipase/carboxylesterase